MQNGYFKNHCKIVFYMAKFIPTCTLTFCDFVFFYHFADFSFLLRFLRAKKFSQLTARDTLQNYWTSKSKYPEWFANIDPADKKLQDFMRCGYVPVAGPHGV